jgi:hypothetical protein
MRLSRPNQKGFISMELFLIVMVAIIVGGTGYFVYQATKKTNDTFSAAAKAADSTPQAQTANDNTTPMVYLIPEWHLTATLKPAPKLLIQHTIKQQSGQTWAQFSSQELKDLDAACASDRTAAAGVINRAKGAGPAYGPDGEPLGKTVQQLIDSGDLKNYKKVGDYYYWYESPQGLCGGTQENQQQIQQVQTATENAVKSIVANLKAE